MKALIVLGGEPPERALAERYFSWADRVLCTDSGANALAAWRLWPDLLVGDMDSISLEAMEAMKAEGVPIERHNPHKDLTDGQLACSLALDMGVKEAVILGGWGGRADHSFANLMMMRYMAEQGVCVRMRCPEQWVKVCGPGRHEVTGTLGGTFSLLPISDGVVVRSIEGAEYPLSEPTAMPLGPTFDLPVGLSNRLLAERAYFDLASGWILCFSPA